MVFALSLSLSFYLSFSDRDSSPEPTEEIKEEQEIPRQSYQKKDDEERMIRSN